MAKDIITEMHTVTLETNEGFQILRQTYTHGQEVAEE